MFSSSVHNRPMKFGERDRREFIVQDSEVALVAINDLSGNPIFLGRAKAGEPLDRNKWQIRFVTYDAAEGVTRVEWPLNDDSAASTDYVYVWNSLTDLTITTITQAATGVVTVSDLEDLDNGDKFIIQGVAGMTELNFNGSNIYTVANINVGLSTFEIQGIDTTGFGAYTSGGIVTYGEVINYTYE